MLDPRVVAERPLRVLAWQVVEGPELASTHAGALDKLHELGLPTHRLHRVCDSFEDVWAAISAIDAARKDYPYETSPLARRNDARPELVDRFELFIHGRELCNAFSELNDPDDQAARFRDQVEKKAKGAEETMDYDDDYIRALEHGMPPAAGFGLGVDRLAMTLLGQPSIRDVIAFPLLRPEVAGS